MVTPAPGSVILVPFPFTDLSKTKLRPALILAQSSKEDWILSQITSKPYSDANAVEIGHDDFVEGSLHITSFVRPGKLFTANHSLFHCESGKIKSDKFKEIILAVINIFHNSLK